MNRLRNTLLGGLTTVLFYTSLACSNQQLYPTPTPTPATVRTERIGVSQNNQLPRGTDSIRSYKPSTHDLQIAEAVDYLQRTRHGTIKKNTEYRIPFDRELGIYSNSIRATSGMTIWRRDKSKNFVEVKKPDSGIFIISVHDNTDNYDLVIPFFNNGERNDIESKLEGRTSVELVRTEPYKTKVYPHEILARSSVDFPIIGRVIDGHMTIIADKENLSFSYSKVILPPKQSGEFQVLQNYSPEVAKRAIKLADFLHNYERNLPLAAIHGDAPSIENIQSRLGDITLFETSVIINEAFKDVYLLDIDEKEMVEFRNAIDSYEEFKKASGFGATSYPNMDPNLKAAIVYTTIFSIRSIHQDPLTAHKYAFAIAQDPILRDGTFEITYDVYFKISDSLERAKIKLNEFDPSDISTRTRQAITEQTTKAKIEIEAYIEQAKRENQEKIENTVQDLNRKSRELQEVLQRKGTEMQSRLEEQGSKARERLEQSRADMKEDINRAVGDIQNFFKKKD